MGDCLLMKISKKKPYQLTPAGGTRGTGTRGTEPQGNETNPMRNQQFKRTVLKKRAITTHTTTEQWQHNTTIPACENTTQQI